MTPYRSGFAAIVGRPNVGKSTLLNALVGEKLAITTPVPQTTRHAVRGVLHRPHSQVVFVDTPGLHKPKTLLGRRLNDTARAALEDVDVVLLVTDGQQGIGSGDRWVAGLLAGLRTPVIAVLNKVDAFRRERQLEQLRQLGELGEFAEVVPVSALRGEQVELLAGLVGDRMPEGPPYFPEGQTSDMPVEQLIAEVIREQALLRVREEVPHSVAAAVDELEDLPHGLVVHAALYVERDSQKGILVGKGGAMLKAIGTAARESLTVLLGRPVHLDLRVRLAKEWQRDPKALNRFGY